MHKYSKSRIHKALQYVTNCEGHSRSSEMAQFESIGHISLINGL